MINSTVPVHMLRMLKTTIEMVAMTTLADISSALTKMSGSLAMSGSFVMSSPDTPDPNPGDAVFVNGGCHQGRWGIVKVCTTSFMESGALL